MINQNKKYHFISGLPRSGSSLLTSILNQNPRFHSSITDPLATMVKGVIESSQEGAGIKFEVPVQRRKNLIYHLFEGYYYHLDHEVFFNTNRAWTYLTPQLKDLYPDAKMIICVRDIKWILDSFELATRRHPFNTTTFHSKNLAGNVYSRADSLMTEDGIVGFSYIGIKQAITSAEKNNLILIEYDQLCKNPKAIMKAIYNFIDEEYFEHDFNNVEASWDEYDAELGADLHKVRKRVEYVQRETILPPDLINKYSNMEVWRMQ